MGKELSEYEREMVTLHIPFRIEEFGILTDIKFLPISDKNEAVIMERREEFESNLDIAETMKICAQLCRQKLSLMIHRIIEIRFMSRIFLIHINTSSRSSFKSQR